MFKIRDKISCLYCDFKYVEHRLASQKEDIDWKL